MPRKAKDTPIEQKVPEGIPAGHALTLAEEKLVHTVNQAVMGSVDIIKAIGRIETAAFFGNIAEKLIVETFLNIKDGKKYKGLSYLDENGNTKNISHLDEFCEVFLKKTGRRCQQLAENYHLIGADLYEQSEAMGLRQRDYNAIKALPSDRQEIIKMAVAAKDKDAVIELLQDVMVKGDHETIAHTKEASDLKGDNAALDRLLKEKTDKLLAAEKRIEFQRFPDVVQDVRVEVVGITGQMVKLLNRMDQLREHILQVDIEGFKDEEAAISPMAQIYYTGLLNLDIAMRNLLADADDVFSGYLLHEQAEGRPGANPVISSEFHAWVTENFNREKAIAVALFGKDPATEIEE